MKRLKEREIQNHLVRHYCNLLLHVSPIVDTSPPFTMYNSPKSIHYRPPPKARSQSTDNLTHQLLRKQGGTKKTDAEVSSIKKSHNVYATKSTSRSSTSTTKTFASAPVNSHASMSKYNQRLSSIESKLRNSPLYQAPTFKTNKKEYETDSSLDSLSASQISQNENNKINSFATESKPNDNKKNFQLFAINSKSKKDDNEQQQKTKKENAEIKSSLAVRQSDDEYELFKENALNRILQRRVYTASVIEDCFARQMRQNAHLDTKRMQRAMNETMIELGVKPNSKTKCLATNKISEVRFQSSFPLTTSLSSISSTNANNLTVLPYSISQNKTNSFLFNEDKSSLLDALPTKHCDNKSVFDESDFSDEFCKTTLIQ